MNKTLIVRNHPIKQRLMIKMRLLLNPQLSRLSALELLTQYPVAQVWDKEAGGRGRASSRGSQISTNESCPWEITATANFY